MFGFKFEIEFRFSKVKYQKDSMIFIRKILIYSNTKLLFKRVISYIYLMKKAFLLLACALGVMNYEAEGDVLKLGSSDFDAALNEYPNMLVKFFAPWCGHCKSLAPTYLEAATALKQAGSSVRLAEVDCTIHKQLCQKYQIRGYPTVNFFAKGEEKPTKYTSQRTKQAIVNWINEKVPAQKAQTEQQKAPQQKKEQTQFQKQGNLYKLTKDSFNQAQKDFDYLFVKFFAPWCGHCKKMAQTWVQFANSITDPKVAIAEVDCTQQGDLCSQNGIQGYPTLKLFVRGNQAVKYQQARTLQNFTSWLQQQKVKLIPGAIPDSKIDVQAEEL